MIKDGGLSMPDFDIIDKSLKAGWVKRLLDPQAQSWKTIPFSLLDSVCVCVGGGGGGGGAVV